MRLASLVVVTFSTSPSFQDDFSSLPSIDGEAIVGDSRSFSPKILRELPFEDALKTLFVTFLVQKSRTVTLGEELSSCN